MTGKSDAAKDEFADAKANIRDTVKWIATTYAALAAFVVGGTSVHGLGGLPPFSLVFWLAALMLILGFAGICFALIVTLQILRPIHMYRSDLLYALAPTIRHSDAAEITIVRNEINSRAHDLLPHNYHDLESLAKNIKDAEEKLGRIPHPSLVPEEIFQRSQGIQSRNRLYTTVNDLLPFAIYFRLQTRLQRALPRLVTSGIVALVALAIYGILTHEKKSDEKPSAPIINFFGLTPSAPPVVSPATLPSLKPILFLTGRAEVSEEGLVAVEQARNALRRHPEVLLLIRAHTDTVAPMPINAALARKRATTVLELLTGTGGIAPARIFVAELPKTDLPRVTATEIDDQSNRSVEMTLIRP
ncbi:OmpA family protein [Variovorax sp.]|uniref:OmpA family protein n=1 Tax=Variovorax sp. TaxID=1871043 RepID=UPI0037DA5AFD